MLYFLYVLPETLSKTDNRVQPHDVAAFLEHGFRDAET